MGPAATKKSYLWIQRGMVILSLIGIFLSTYALYIEAVKELDGNYQAMCDISESMSCSKVLTSKYGRGFGVLGELLGEDHILNQPNCIFGMIFYCLIIIMGTFESLNVARFQQVLVCLSNLMSIYLAYLLYYVLKDFCVLCVSTYIVNFLLTILAFKRIPVLQRLKKQKHK